MKFTSEDLLNAMGLKVGQTVCVDNTMNFLIYEKGDIYFENLRSHSVISIDKFVEYILNFDYYIIQPKPTLTEDEIRALVYGYFKHKCRWVVCNEDGSVIAFDIKPTRYLHSWGSNENHTAYNLNIGHKPMLQFIKWEDEPYSYEDLLFTLINACLIEKE